ncbi:MAG: AMP-binding protein [Alphaproteobacteria bacterium]|nr:AMP-binding protein [Alphaproteobacteria bacterium]
MSAHVLHHPSEAEKEASRLAHFVWFVEAQTGINFGAAGPESYMALHRWSVEHSGLFHSMVWDFFGLLGDKGKVDLKYPKDILKAQFFPDSKISFTENMLAHAVVRPDEPAIIARVAGREGDRVLSWRNLYDQVSVWTQVLERLGVVEGDRVAVYLPHIPEAYILMMAAANLGAIFSSVGTEMGAQATANRFAQIEPKVLIAVDGYVHMSHPDKPAKREERLGVVAELQAALPSLAATVILPNLDAQLDLGVLNAHTYLADTLLGECMPQEMAFVRRDFNQPLAILFSSGSTGQPKCFVHGVGGCLLKHAIEHGLQSDVHAGDKVFFHSTVSWMMFNWLASGLVLGAAVMIYDGNPAYPSADAQLRFAAEYGCTHLGTAAAIIQDVWAKNGVDAKGLHLQALRCLMYTGSVLSDSGFEYVDQHIKGGLSINGVCGGTDFVGGYAWANPFFDTVAGQLKGFVLGMDADIWGDDGHPVEVGEVGELVIKAPFASRPLYFWNDKGNKRFRAEYFEYFKVRPAVWRHGDAVMRCAGGQIKVEGRSDTTLNQGGVRIGTQQLYDAMGHPDFSGLVEDFLAANFKDVQGGDHTALFVVLSGGVALSEELKAQIKTVISDSVGRLSTPHEILAVPYVLKTPNGKRAEKPTSKLLAGQDVKAPETYGVDSGGLLKTALFAEIGVHLQGKPVYGFVADAV